MQASIHSSNINHLHTAPPPPPEAPSSTILDKISSRERITEADALSLFQAGDPALLSRIGSIAREARHGRNAFYTINRHINYSNICVLDCDFCAFGKRKRDAGAYELTIDEMVAN